MFFFLDFFISYVTGKLASHILRLFSYIRCEMKLSAMKCQKNVIVKRAPNVGKYRTQTVIFTDICHFIHDNILREKATGWQNSFPSYVYRLPILIEI